MILLIGKGGGKGGGIDHVSWKIKLPFHISRTINSAFHDSREKNKPFHTISFSYFGYELQPKNCLVRCPHHSPASCSWCCEKEKNLATFPGADLG